MQGPDIALGGNIVAGCSFDIGYDGFLSSGEEVKQRAFSGVGRAYKGYAASVDY